MKIAEVISWLEQSVLQGNELGHNTAPIVQVIAVVRAADKMRNADSVYAREEAFKEWDTALIDSNKLHT